MNREDTDKMIKAFLQDRVDNDVSDFGYLLMTDEIPLNDEATIKIKVKFNSFKEAYERVLENGSRG